MKGIYAQKSLPEINESGTSEHDLWVAVLSKAAHDAIECSDWREARLAIEWFKAGRKDFKDVCQYAGREPGYVHKAMKIPLAKREAHMSMVRNGQRIYVAETKKRATRRDVGQKRQPYRPRKNYKMVLRGMKGGRPRLYDV